MNIQRNKEVSVELLTNGQGKVIVDGHDISNVVSQVSIEMKAGYVSRVMLWCWIHKTTVMGTADVAFINETEGDPVLPLRRPDGYDPVEPATESAP